MIYDAHSVRCRTRQAVAPTAINGFNRYGLYVKWNFHAHTFTPQILKHYIRLYDNSFAYVTKHMAANRAEGHSSNGLEFDTSYIIFDATFIVSSGNFEVTAITPFVVP